MRGAQRLTAICLFTLITFFPLPFAFAEETVLPKKITASITEDCLDFSGNVYIVTIELPSQAKLTMRLWGRLYADLKEGKPIALEAQSATLYHDTTGKTGEADLCDPDGICKSVAVKLDISMEDGAVGTVQLEDTVIHIVTAYNGKRVICG